MSAAVAAALKKAAVYILGDEKKRGAYVPAYCCDLKYWKYEY